MNFEMSGLNDLQKQLNKIEKEIEKVVNGEARLDELFSKNFLEKSTNNKFSTIDDFLEASKAVLNNDSNTLLVVDKKINSFVVENTKYSSWEEFKQAAGEVYAANKLREYGFEVEED